MYDLDEDKILQSFVWYCVSKLKDEKIMDLLFQFRDDFREVVLNKLNSDIEMKHGDDEVVVQHKKKEVQKDLDYKMSGVEINIEKMVDDMGFSKDEWKKKLYL